MSTTPDPRLEYDHEHEPSVSGHTDEAHAIADDERLHRLTAHLAALVQRGARIEEHRRFGAVVVARTKAHITPNVVMALAGIIAFTVTREPLFIIAAAVSTLGWHRKASAAGQMRRLLVRVDEIGRVREIELGSEA